MKYNDLPDVETEVTKNKYVTVDIKPKRGARDLKNIKDKLKSSDSKFTFVLIPLLAVTVVSIGLMIAQIAKLASLTDVTTILSSLL